MKNMFKGFIAALAATLAFSACGGAHAADADLVVNSTGTEITGLVNAIGLAPASQCASGKTCVLFENSTGWQNVEDPSGAKYTYVKGRLLAVGGVEVGATGVIYVPNRMVRTGCNGSPLSSYVQATSTSQTRTDYMSNDGCAYRDKVRPLAN